MGTGANAGATRAPEDLARHRHAAKRCGPKVAGGAKPEARQAVGAPDSLAAVKVVHRGVTHTDARPSLQAAAGQ